MKHIPMLCSVFFNLVCLDALRADLDAFHALGCFNADLLEIRKPDLLGLVLSMGNVVPGLRAFPAYITSS
jgi:hypothetical protein